MVDEFCEFLAGRRDEVVARLRSLQGAAAERREYERAARLRDQVRRLESVLARQRMVDVSGASTDVLGVARQGDRCCVVVLRVRERRVVAREVRWLQGGGIAGEADLLRAFVTLNYAQADSIPETIVVETDPEEAELVRGYLAKHAAGTVRVRQPRDAAERALLRMARRNAALLVARSREQAGRGLEKGAADEALELQRSLGLARLPRRIRCFDVSQLFGTHVVASMVTFVDGRPAKGEYRRFKIRSVEGQDDFASIAEAVRRHAARVEAGEMAPADLILIDGGVGQLGAALGAVRGTALADVPFAGLAKKLEEIVRAGAAPLRLSRRSPGLKLLQRVRDEAHRFAITYHRALRSRSSRSSSLERVPGLGPKRRALLLQRFGSVARLSRQPLASIAAVPGIGERMAARILEFVAPGGGAE
jgi:excinuclease ABC subunit C